ncbi:MAG TPA: ABC transporter permease [bacterium]|nr:ABC transporter permease [bacterium]
MRGYLAYRVMSAIPTVLGVTIFVFMFVHLLPGDPARLMAGLGATDDSVQLVRHSLGLDKPLWTQYSIYIRGVLQGDLGISNRDATAVSVHLAQAFIPTAELTVAGIAVAMLVGLTAGIVAANAHNTPWDVALTSGAMLGISLPSFVLAFILIWVFAVTLRMFPTGGDEGAFAIVLPAVTLGVGAAATIARITRSEMLGVTSQDYIRAAHAKGHAPLAVILRHALPNTLIPVLTVIGLQFGFLISGAIIVETVFSWHGLGRLLVDAIGFRDYPVIQGVVLLFALEFIAVNILTDVLYAWVDPRIRYQG